MPRWRAEDEDHEALVLAGPGTPGGDRGERKAGVPGDDQGISNRPDDEEEDEFDDGDDDEDDDEESDDADEVTEPD